MHRIKELIIEKEKLESVSVDEISNTKVILAFKQTSSISEMYNIYDAHKDRHIV
jgi:hypothetical protein